MSERVIFLLLILGAHGFPHFEEEIPNGRFVTHPCKANYVWKGVGHTNTLGGGPRNQFGKDFFTHGKVWTRALCMLDSDGDGLSNGEELGDPQCVWSKGKPPTRRTLISHPGICEPFESPQCADLNTWVDCSYGEFQCDPLDKENDLLNISLTFPKTEVPDIPTSYRCLTFDLPADGDYHMIAQEPIIDNDQVLHHIAVYGCSDSAKPVTTPTECFMTTPECRTIIGGWAVGLPGGCLHPETGVSIGTKGFRKAYVQLHWTNHKVGRVNYTDGSGIKFYLTRKKRKYNQGIFHVGQEYMKLPPGRKSITVEGECSEKMLRMRLLGPIYVTEAANHMHYLGKSIITEIYRKGKRVAVLSHDPRYSYDSPVIHRHDPPTVIQPGDSILTRCTYDTSPNPKTVFRGFGTLDEMCYSFIFFYPKENVLVENCVPWKTIDWTLVKFHRFIPFFKPVIERCNFAEFMSLSNPKTQALHSAVSENCNTLGDCLEECITVIREIRKHPCMQGDIGEYIRESAREGDLGSEFVDFYNKMDSCTKELTSQHCRRIVFVQTNQRCPV